MPVQVSLKGTFDVVVLDEDFAGIANTLNMAGASGRQFVVADQLDGEPILISLNQILTIREVDNEEDALIA